MKTKTKTNTTTAANKISLVTKFALTPVSYNKEHLEITSDYINASLKGFRTCKVKGDLPEGFSLDEVAHLETQMQCLAVAEGAARDGLDKTLVQTKGLGLPKEVVRDRVGQASQHLANSGVRGFSRSTLSRRMAKAGYAKDEVKARARAVGVAKAKERRAKEAKPLAEALRDYAMNAAKTKGKARAALEAALALLA